MNSQAQKYKTAFFTLNKYNVGDFVWFRSGDYDIECQVKTVFIEIDEIETKVSYRIQVLNIPEIMNENIYVMKEKELSGGREELEKIQKCKQK